MTILANAPEMLADAALRDRAERVIPGGMYGHMSVQRMMPPSYPQFYRRGAGARLWDVDGNEYIDFMCSFGPMLAGYANPTIDAAARVQQDAGDLLSGPTPLVVEYAERLVAQMPHAEWAMFAKNGTDATTIAVMIARAATGRSTLLKAAKAYHGANAWFTPGVAGITAADRADIAQFEYNDLASLEATVAAADGDVAAIIVTPFRHDGFVDQEFVTPEFARGAREIATRIGAVLILDEVRTAFRLDLSGAWESIGVRPDLTAMSKSLGNGYPLSAVVGVESLRTASTEIFVTGSFWMGSVGFAAGIATLDYMIETDGLTRMHAAGLAFRDGLQQQAEAHGFQIVQTGPVSMPFLRFVDDPELATARAFTDATIRRGVLMHPWHNMFLSSAHSSDDIATALERTDDAFDEIAGKLL